MRENGITPTYISAFVLLLVAGLFLLATSALRSSIARLDDKLREVETLGSRYMYTELEQNISKLIAAQDKHQVAVYDEHEVKVAMLEYADNLSKRFEAEITAGFDDDGRNLSVTMVIEKRPKNVEVFNSLLRELLAQRNPMVHIKTLTFDTDDLKTSDYKFMLEYMLVMPYVLDKGESLLIDTEPAEMEEMEELPEAEILPEQEMSL